MFLVKDRSPEVRLMPSFVRSFVFSLTLVWEHVAFEVLFMMAMEKMMLYQVIMLTAMV